MPTLRKDYTITIAAKHSELVADVVFDGTKLTYAVDLMCRKHDEVYFECLMCRNTHADAHNSYRRLTLIMDLED